MNHLEYPEEFNKKFDDIKKLSDEILSKTDKYDEEELNLMTKKELEDILMSLNSKMYRDSLEDMKKNEGALPRQKTLDQLKMVRKLSKSTDIGDRVPDLKKQGANIHYYQNPIDTGIESYEDYEKKNKSFIPGWNLKHLTSPFKGEK